MSIAADRTRTVTTEVYALRYASMRGRRASDTFLRDPSTEADDRLMTMDCYFWVIRSGSQVMLLDSGWNRNRGLAGTGRRFSQVAVDQQDPVDLLARLDISPGDVGHVIVSHMHFDHVGNLDLFPDAALSVARAEFAYWTGPHGRRRSIAHSTAPDDVQVIRDRERAGLVHLVDRAEEVAPGVTIVPVGGHTPGQMIVEVTTPTATVVLASDAAHYHEELEHDRPFYIYSDMPALLSTYDLLRAKAAQPRTWVVAGHDPAEMDRFEQVNDDCVDLSKPIM